MIPTLNGDGGGAFVNRYDYEIFGENYKVGDVVIAQANDDRHKTICKRITAVAGETVVVQNKYNSHYPRRIVHIPEGHVWLAGDNPAHSCDSRHYGPVSEELLKGRVFAKTVGSFPFVQWVDTPYKESDRVSLSRAKKDADEKKTALHETVQIIIQTAQSDISYFAMNENSLHSVLMVMVRVQLVYTPLLKWKKFF